MRYLKYMLFIAGLLAFVVSTAWGDELREKSVVATVNPDGTQRVEILGGGYYFDPNVIVVKVNIPVELIVRKEAGITPHDIVLKAPDAGINFAESLSTDPKTIRFTPTKVGKYPFECSKRLLFFKSHKDQGMHGVLEVVE
jgi:plastocyanin domain-containing protein